MVTKGIITSIDFGGNTCKVRVPFFETAGNDPIIGNAIISNTPGMYNGYKVGDVVLVAFEDGQMDNPVVIGKLYLGAEKEKADPRGSLNTESLIASKTATVPADTKLTTNTDKNLPNTMNPYANLSSIANNLNKLNTDVTYLDAFSGNQFRSIITDANGMRSSIEQNAANIEAKVDREHDGITTGLGWNLTDNKWTIDASNTSWGAGTKVTLFEVDDTGNVIINGDVRIGGYPVSRTRFYKKLAADSAAPEAPADDTTTDGAIALGWNETYTWESGYHIWETVQTVSYSKNPEGDGLAQKITYSPPVDVTGAAGEQGIGIKSQIIYYAMVGPDIVHAEKPDYAPEGSSNPNNHVYGNSDGGNVIDLTAANPVKGYGWSTTPPEYIDNWNYYTSVLTIYSDDDRSFADPVKAQELDGVYELAQGKSKNYYSKTDPQNLYVIKSGDCWFSLGQGAEYTAVSYSLPADTKSARTPPAYDGQLYTDYDWRFVKEISLNLPSGISSSDAIGAVRRHVSQEIDDAIQTASNSIAANTANVLSERLQHEEVLFENPTGETEYVLPSTANIQDIVDAFIWAWIGSDEAEDNMHDAGNNTWTLTVFGPYDLYAFDEDGCRAKLLAELLRSGPIAELIESGYYYQQNGSPDTPAEITAENCAGLLSFTTNVNKLKTNTYTGYCEGTLSFNGIKSGVTLYRQSKKAAGDLKQWVGNPSNAANPGGWEDIGGELVANKVTAKYVNALDITAKKITVLQNATSTSSPILFEADGLSNPPSVQIARFKVDSTALTAGTPGSASSVLVSPGYSIQGTSSTASNNFMGFSSDELSNKQWALTADANFGLDTSGNVYAKNFYITNTDNTNRLQISTEKANMQIAERIKITEGGIRDSDVTVRKIEIPAAEDEYRAGEYKVTLADLSISAWTENYNNLTAAKDVYAKVSFVLKGTKNSQSSLQIDPMIPMSGTVKITIAAGSKSNSTTKTFYGHGGTAAIIESEYGWEITDFRYIITDRNYNEQSTNTYGDVTLSRDTFYMYGDILPSNPSYYSAYLLGAPNKKWRDIFSDYAHVSSLQADNIGADRLVASAISADKIDGKTVKIRTEDNDGKYTYANLYYVAVAVPADTNNSTVTTNIKTDNTVKGAFCYVPGSNSAGVPYNFYITMTYSGRTITLTNKGLATATTACIFYIV